MVKLVHRIVGQFTAAHYPNVTNWPVPKGVTLEHLPLGLRLEENNRRIAAGVYFGFASTCYVSCHQCGRARFVVLNTV